MATMPTVTTTSQTQSPRQPVNTDDGNDASDYGEDAIEDDFAFGAPFVRSLTSSWWPTLMRADGRHLGLGDSREWPQEKICHPGARKACNDLFQKVLKLAALYVTGQMEWYYPMVHARKEVTRDHVAWLKEKSTPIQLASRVTNSVQEVADRFCSHFGYQRVHPTTFRDKVAIPRNIGITTPRYEHALREYGYEARTTILIAQTFVRLCDTTRNPLLLGGRSATCAQWNGSV